MQDQITIYETSDWKVKIWVLFEEENLWLSQKLMAELFETTPQNVTLHLWNIYNEKELEEKSTCKDFLQVQKEWNREVKRNTKMYSLETIIAVWYRVNSQKATQFRIWATDKLKNYILKGFAIDKERFIHWSKFDARYFDELLEEIREIRASERMSYQKITDIYATSFDYSQHTAEAEKFFATVQNKLHFAITWNTAAEIIYNRVDSKKENMGLTTWRKAPKWKIYKSDIIVAKNYLEKDELKDLNHIVDMYLDYAEFQASRWKIMYMKDWREKLDAFLKFTEQEILQNAWKISHEVAVALAEKEYEKFKPIQDKLYKSDFDNIVIELKQQKLN